MTLIAAEDPTWFATPLDEREKGVVGQYWSWSGPAARKVTLAADRGISGFGITPSGGRWRLSGSFLFARFDTGEVLFSRMSTTGNFYGDIPLRKADLPVKPRNSADVIRTSIMPRIRFRIVSFYMDNTRQAAESQKRVFDRLGLGIEQVKTCVAHGIAVDDWLASHRDLDCTLLFDVDCVPLHRDAIPTLLANAADDRVVGVAAQSNHLNANHPYAQASCLAVPMRLWEGMGMPSLRGSCHVEGAANRSDTAEEFTWAAEEDGVAVSLLWPCHVEEPKHRLGLDKMFGYGVTYAASDGVPLLYHAGECRFGAGRFLRKCGEALAAPG